MPDRVDNLWTDLEKHNDHDLLILLAYSCKGIEDHLKQLNGSVSDLNNRTQDNCSRLNVIETVRHLAWEKQVVHNQLMEERTSRFNMTWKQWIISIIVVAIIATGGSVSLAQFF